MSTRSGEQLTRLKTFLRFTGVVVLTAGACLGGALALDQYLHGKFDPVASLNDRGYRGAVVGAKAPREHRVGIFGGSVAMGYGVMNDQSIAGHLQRLLDHAAPGFTVINLAMTGEAGVAFFAANYRHFEYLELDSVAFLIYDEGITCRVDDTTVPNWESFVEKLVRGHPALAEHIIEASGLRSQVEARHAVEGQRRAVMHAFNDALRRPDAVDRHAFEGLQRSYFVGQSDHDRSTADDLACLTNLLLLQETLGKDLRPPAAIAQQAFTKRTSNPIFRHFNYWFILDEVAWEKYFLLRYGDIAEGARRDPLRALVANAGGRIFRPATKDSALQPGAVQALTLTDFVGAVTGTGKRVYFLLFPRQQHRGQLSGARMYLDYLSRHLDAVQVVDLHPIFDEHGWAASFPDGDYHFSSSGNRLAAEALFDAMRIGVTAK